MIRLDPKIIPLGSHCALMYSGATLFATQIAESVITDKGKARHSVEDYANCVKDKLHDTRTKRIQDNILTPRGLEFDTLYRKDIQVLPEAVVGLIDAAIERLDTVHVIMTVSGIDADGTASIYAVVPPGEMLPVDAGGYRSIGIGKDMADLSLMRAQQHNTLGLGQTIFNVFAAKRDAEFVAGVGRKTSMMIIHRKGCKTLSADEISNIAESVENAGNSFGASLSKAAPGLMALTDL